MNLYDLLIKSVDGRIVSDARNVSFAAVNTIISDLPEQPYFAGSTTITITFKGKR